MVISADKVSGLLEYLPALFQEDRIAGQPNFLGRFLLAFEHLLLGLGDPAEPGLEETVAHLYRYFEPGTTLTDAERIPKDFLPWLAGWAALALRGDWDEQRQRDFIARAVPLYQLRGTKRGVEEFLRIYTRLGVEIDELNTPLQIGVHSTIGEDTIIDGGTAFFFRVRLSLASPNPAQIGAQRAVATAIIDLQKPAHTFYQQPIDVVTPTFRIAVNSTVGVDTLIDEPRPQP